MILSAAAVLTGTLIYARQTERKAKLSVRLAALAVCLLPLFPAEGAFYLFKSELVSACVLAEPNFGAAYEDRYLVTGPDFMTAAQKKAVLNGAAAVKCVGKTLVYLGQDGKTSAIAQGTPVGVWKALWEHLCWTDIQTLADRDGIFWAASQTKAGWDIGSAKPGQPLEKRGQVGGPWLSLKLLDGQAIAEVSGDDGKFYYSKPPFKAWAQRPAFDCRKAPGWGLVDFKTGTLSGALPGDEPRTWKLPAKPDWKAAPPRRAGNRDFYLLPVRAGERSFTLLADKNGAEKIWEGETPGLIQTLMTGGCYQGKKRIFAIDDSGRPLKPVDLKTLAQAIAGIKNPEEAAASVLKDTGGKLWLLIHETAEREKQKNRYTTEKETKFLRSWLVRADAETGKPELIKRLPSTGNFPFAGIAFFSTAERGFFLQSSLEIYFIDWDGNVKRIRVI